MVLIACYSVKIRRFSIDVCSICRSAPSAPPRYSSLPNPFTPPILALLAIKYTSIHSHVSPISLTYSLIASSLFCPFLPFPLFSSPIKRSSTSSIQEPPASHRCQSLRHLQWQGGLHVLDRASKPVQRERAGSKASVHRAHLGLDC